MGCSEQESRKGPEQTEAWAGALGGGQLGGLGPAMRASLFSQSPCSGLACEAVQSFQGASLYPCGRNACEVCSYIVYELKI